MIRKTKSKYTFPLILCLISLLFSIINIVFLWINNEVIHLYCFEMLFFLVLLLFVFVFMLITIKKHGLFASLTSLILAVSYNNAFYKIKKFGFNWKIDRKFIGQFKYPWLMVIEEFSKIGPNDPWEYVKIYNIVDWNFIISLFGVFVFIILKILEKRNQTNNI